MAKRTELYMTERTFFVPGVDSATQVSITVVEDGETSIAIKSGGHTFELPAPEWVKLANAILVLAGKGPSDGKEERRPANRKKRRS